MLNKGNAVDVSVRAQILNLLEELQSDFSLTYRFVSHDLSVIRCICDGIVVMYVEEGGRGLRYARPLSEPKHPYTEALLSSVPIAEPAGSEDRSWINLQGEIADPSNLPSRALPFCCNTWMIPG